MAGMDGFGVQLQRGDGAATEVFTPIADITSLNPPGMSRETIDVTSHDSPDAWMEFLGSVKDGGEVSADINYQPSVHDVLVADFEDSAPRNYRVVFPDEAQTTWGFKALMTGFEPEIPYDDKATASLTWKVSGKPNLSAGV
ncbi:phage tail tube protein [Streptomyces sp. AC04842]|uniref:phage tail tube protein n=1 Tax=Streptomyces sp. AC04842 TaxID=2775327 RepID=UPI0020C68C13|nr:outer capsid protein Hoc [Streptomyces sp. AC04842]